MKRGHAMTTLPTTGPVTSPPRPPAALRMTPGRWVTLAIGVPIALVLIGWSAFSLVAGIGQASFPVSTTIPVQNGRLVASTGGGDITVHQGQVSGGTARLTGKVEYSLVRPTFTVSGSGISLHCRLPTGNCGLNATLDVPSHTAVDLNTGGGNMQVSGIQGNVTLDSGGGDVGISGIGGTADVLTGGGNLTASDLGGVLTFTTSGGDVDGSGLFSPHVTTDSGGGNVTLVFTAGSGLRQGRQQRRRHHHRGPARQHQLRHQEHRRAAATTAPRCRPTTRPATRSRWTAAAATSASPKPADALPGQLIRSELRKVATFWVPRLAGTET